MESSSEILHGRLESILNPEGRSQYQRVVRQDGIDSDTGGVLPVFGHISADSRSSNEDPRFRPMNDFDLIFRRQISDIDPIGTAGGEGLGKLNWTVGDGGRMCFG
ncbi:MAG: hypothetical protein ACI92S_005569 [Planctomycetaceae bacterium]